jgi:hypothetical protein
MFLCNWALETLFTNAILASKPRDLLEVWLGPIMRVRAKRFKKAIDGLLQDKWAKVDFKRISNNKEQALINLIYLQEELLGFLDIFHGI